MDLEFLSKASSWANAAVLVFTLLAVVAGVAAWHFSSQYRVAKDAAFERFKLQSAVSIAESAARTAEATKKASEAGEETAKPRQISEEQRTRLMTLLSAASPKGLVGLGCVRGDAEGGTLAEQIEEILKAAGWTTTGIAQASYDG